MTYVPDHMFWQQRVAAERRARYRFQDTY